MYLPTVMGEGIAGESAELGLVGAAARPASKWHYRSENATASANGSEVCGYMEFDGMQYELYSGYSLNVNIFGDWSKESPGKPVTGSGIYVDIYRYNDCTNEYEYHYGQAPIANSDVKFDSAKGNAMVDTTVELCDSYEYPEPVCYAPITISLTWTGTGDGYSGRSVDTNNFMGCRTRWVSQGTYSDATASGTVTIEGEQFTINEAYGRVARVHNGSMEQGLGCYQPPIPLIPEP